MFKTLKVQEPLELLLKPFLSLALQNQAFLCILEKLKGLNSSTFFKTKTEGSKLPKNSLQ